ncbi:hypothetical protein K523DRAFT_319975 [Schizophyllum commune Tattone D]|nr:hypothetical protein K523DRAFT_319975 [Schizophyllum commune Tattone D]
MHHARQRPATHQNVDIAQSAPAPPPIVPSCTNYHSRPARFPLDFSLDSIPRFVLTFLQRPDAIILTYDTHDPRLHDPRLHDPRRLRRHAQTKSLH